MIASDFDSAEKRFRNIEPFQYNNTEYAVAHPSVSPDGKVMAISSNMPKGQGRSDIYICKKMSAGKWSRPVNAGQFINTEGEEAFPYWADNRTLCFSSDGQAGMGGLDIYTSEWDEKSGTFSKPVNIGAPLNSSYDDISLSVNAANGNTWFSSNRPAPKGGDNIYFYKRTKVFLQIIVKDSATQVPLPASRVAISAPEEKENALTDNAGTYIRRLYPTRQYSAIIEKEGYTSATLSLTAIGNKETDTVTRTVLLIKKEPPRRDTIAVLPPAPVVIRNRNVMDPPGIQDFTLDQTYEVGHFYYDYNKYELLSMHQSFLDTMMTQLKRHPSMRIEIQAHTDCRGSVASNKILSDKRALSVVNYLVKHGIARSRLTYVGLGSKKL